MQSDSDGVPERKSILKPFGVKRRSIDLEISKPFRQTLKREASPEKSQNTEQVRE